MPHKDRATRLAYARDYHETHRGRPAPEPQPGRGDLPPAGMLIDDDDGGRVQCHACGRFFGSLVTHVRMHGLDADRYKEAYGLARTASLLSPATAAKQRAAALARDQAGVLRRLRDEGGIPTRPRPQGLPNRLQSRVRTSAAKIGTYRGGPRPPVAPTPPPPDTTGTLTVPESAVYLGLSRGAIYGAIRAGRLPIRRADATSHDTRIARAALDAYRETPDYRGPRANRRKTAGAR